MYPVNQMLNHEAAFCKHVVSFKTRSKKSEAKFFIYLSTCVFANICSKTDHRWNKVALAGEKNLGKQNQLFSFVSHLYPPNCVWPYYISSIVRFL